MGAPAGADMDIGDSVDACLQIESTGGHFLQECSGTWGLFFKPSNSRPKAQVEAWRENFPGTGSGFLLYKHLHFELL